MNRFRAQKKKTKRTRTIKLTSDILLSEIAKLHDKDIDLGLERFLTLLERLDNPQKKLPPTIHVAGTNGKGSTIAFLRAFFESVGYKVHSFTSPHFFNARETVNLAGNEIDEDIYCALLQEVIDANAGAPLTVFEAMTAAAFLAFSRSKGHVLLLETGMGGLGDTTNVIEAPIACAITPISLDHKEFLGESVAEIACHKAGILKKDVPVVIAKQEDEAYHAIRERAKQLNVLMYRERREWFIKKAGERVIFEGWQGIDRAWPRPALIGSHQVQNAGVALACLELVKDRFNFPDEALNNAMRSVHWPGRLERVVLPTFDPKWEIWLDGAHNEAAGKALRRQLKKWDDRPLYLVLGMLKRKDSKPFIREIADVVDHVYTVPIPNQPCKKPERLALNVMDIGATATVCEDLPLALELIKRERKKTGRIVICGSLSLVANFYELQSRT
ncbi:bifunctional folylpolyglutamate synthase/dihydrofolate synthase [Terasakiella brassicae]|uniref:bifunctional folylpolyglutamate synthase/dihydrofolate synthase n=1 Tax=Terasakiella brassicae TaxID=1634917 RepID=UPI001669D038|nr:folylpolyglutamate synthase/dihydrofolate synthase family protein [Terasakiella brassicae]